MAEQAQVEGAAVAENDEEYFLTVHTFIEVPGYGELPEEMKGDTIVPFRRGTGALAGSVAKVA